MFINVAVVSFVIFVLPSSNQTNVGRAVFDLLFCILLLIVVFMVVLSSVRVFIYIAI
jgi:hypothetical protein